MCHCKHQEARGLIQNDTRSRPQISGRCGLLCRLVHIRARNTPSVPSICTHPSSPDCYSPSISMNVSSLDEFQCPIRIERTSVSESIVVDASSIIDVGLVASIPDPRRPGSLLVASRRIHHRPCSLGSTKLPATVDVRLFKDQLIFAPSCSTGGRDSDF
jgi:hypothetical protein